MRIALPVSVLPHHLPAPACANQNWTAFDIITKNLTKRDMFQWSQPLQPLYPPTTLPMSFLSTIAFLGLCSAASAFGTPPPTFAVHRSGIVVASRQHFTALFVAPETFRRAVECAENLGVCDIDELVKLADGEFNVNPHRDGTAQHKNQIIDRNYPWPEIFFFVALFRLSHPSLWKELEKTQECVFEEGEELCGKEIQDRLDVAEMLRMQGELLKRWGCTIKLSPTFLIVCPVIKFLFQTIDNSPFTTTALPNQTLIFRKDSLDNSNLFAIDVHRDEKIQEREAYKKKYLNEWAESPNEGKAGAGLGLWWGDFITSSWNIRGSIQCLAMLPAP